ncbi:MAG TPA: hypothetical protein VKE88_02760 [Candidatus Nanoarchaeia archaeon]|nr:hypothetical protein [Candidatus Nanoarchaeia archaeon]
MVSIDVIFTLTILVGIIVSLYAIYTNRYSIDENRRAVVQRTLAIFLLTLGFSIHTAGDFFGVMYNSETIELVLEDIAHVMLFISFSIFAFSASNLIKQTKEHWFK